MGWRDWSYARKGAVVSLIIGMIIELMIVVISVIFGDGGGTQDIFWLVGIAIFLVVILISILVFWFLGLLIGWLYGKIKSKQT